MSAASTRSACEAFRPLIGDFVDGSLEGPDRTRLEEHVEACPDCQRAVADLSQIRRVARSLPPRTPRADAWRRIASELARELPPARATRRAPWTIPLMTLAAAAVLVLAVASTMWFVRQPSAPAGLQPAAGSATASSAAAQGPSSPVHPAPDDLVNSVDEELKAAESHYEKAITGLEQMAKAEQSTLDPALAATLQKNLDVIDNAIRESRAAIQAQPASQLAQNSLFEALRRKVALLEDTIALINVMRKGDEAGTAKVIQGLSKS